MKTRLSIFLSVLIFTMPVTLQAAEYGKYDITNIFEFKDSKSDNKAIRINVEYFDRIISDLNTHAANYPPKFDSIEDQSRAVNDVTAISKILEILLDGMHLDILLRAGIINSIGYNLDIPDSGEKVTAIYQRIFKANPEHPNANYHYGVFLGNSNRPKEAIPYLNKALSSGVPSAAYSLGMVNLFIGNKEKAIEYLEMHQAKNPDDTNTAGLIRNIQNSELKTNITDRSIRTLMQFNSMIQNYYLHPYPEYIEGAILFSSNEKLFEKTNYNLLGFFAVVFQKHQDYMPKWQKIIQSTSPQAQKELLFAMSIAKDNSLLIEPNLHSPAYNDMYWGAFFAAGDDIYLQRLVNELKHVDERKDSILFLTGATARWSLASNALQHKKVKSYLESIISNSDARTKEIIQEILKGDPRKMESEMVEVLKSQKKLGVWQ